jgi:hypothetical protein
MYCFLPLFLEGALLEKYVLIQTSYEELAYDEKTTIHMKRRTPFMPGTIREFTKYSFYSL